MNKSIAKKWITALRSGDYKKAKGQLRQEEGFCCLGVLCNLHALENPLYARTQTDPYNYGGNRGTLPSIVMRWAGLKSQYGGTLPEEVVVDFRKSTSLVELNDDTNASFKKIACVIEKYWEAL